MRAVAIIGVGSTPFGKIEGQGIVDLAVSACREALAEARVPREKIQAFYLGNFVGERLANQGALAPVVAGRLGLTGIPATKVEGACASGGIAFRHGFLTIALGLYDFVLVAGTEKMTASSTPDVTAALATAGDEDLEMRSGLTFPGAFAVVMREHMARYGTTREQIGLVSVKNHGLGAQNPKAQFRKSVTVEEVLASRLIADPIRLFDCPPISDGAAAVLLCPAERARDFHGKPIKVLGSGHASGPAALWQMDDITSFPATVRAAREAYAMAESLPVTCGWPRSTTVLRWQRSSPPKISGSSPRERGARRWRRGGPVSTAKWRSTPREDSSPKGIRSGPRDAPRSTSW